eukprot:gnl/TRDRNA2_/TRDRNA2_79249_c0_seq1.p1 gnl/TRDRNA2_/TRDRNA2_79249_c0~~gnl/TRDRNA2_/TRDRNA2_79249_c0_seq1.p1  ORF type:complete len:200 (+),score=18.72 gnl/TRDRNA2_/TRDRNA2_79249_c0_seq1:43-600(+)
MVDVRCEHGCMKVIADVGPEVGLLEHVKSELGTAIRPDLLPTANSMIQAEMDRGDLLLLSKFTPHCSQPNLSDKVRWSIDLRFQKTGTPTGRPFWPAFILQSQKDPSSVQDSYEEWCRRWISDLETSKGARWHRVAGDVGGQFSQHSKRCGDPSSFAVSTTGMEVRDESAAKRSRVELRTGAKTQ